MKERRKSTHMFEFPAHRRPHFRASLVTLLDERADVVEGRQDSTLHKGEERALTDDHFQAFTGARLSAYQCLESQQHLPKRELVIRVWCRSGSK